MQKFGRHLENLSFPVVYGDINEAYYTVRESSLCVTRWRSLKTLKNDFVREYCYLTKILGYFFLYSKIILKRRGGGAVCGNLLQQP